MLETKQVQNRIIELTDDQFHVLLGSITLLKMLFDTHPAELVNETNAEDKLRIGICVAGLEARSKAYTTLADNLTTMVLRMKDESNV